MSLIAVAWSFVGLAVHVPAFASASTPALHIGTNPSDALRRAAEAAAVEPNQVALQTITELLAGATPFPAGGSHTRACTLPSAPSAERTAEALRIAIRDVLHDEALDIGGRLIDLLPCQAANANPNDLALAWFRYGYVLALERQSEPARAAFSQALVFDPTLTWDPNLAPDGAPLFSSARTDLLSAPPARLTLYPPPAGLRWDGVAPAGTEATFEGIRPGWHVVEWGDDGQPRTPLAIELGPGANEALLFPGLVADDALTGVVRGDPLLATVVEQALPPFSPAWAVIGRDVYVRPTAGVPWKPVEQPNDTLPRVLRWTALGSTGAGAILVGSGAAIALTSVREGAAADSRNDWNNARTRYSVGRGLYQAGWGALTLGGVAGASLWVVGGRW